MTAGRCLLNVLLALALFPLFGCGDSQPKTAPPPPAKLSREAVGYYCGMIVADHPGPKGQIFLEGQEEPLWFTSVRDTVAFTMLPEESKALRAIYVQDMAEAMSWEAPGDDAWMKAEEAHYVIGSSRRGGMGATEAVPFSDAKKAAAFAVDFGGLVVGWSEIPKDTILGGPEAEAPSMEDHPSQNVTGGEENKSPDD